MKKTLLRVYDKNQKNSLLGENYFIVLPENYDCYDLETCLWQVTNMKWQTYTSYLLGTADIKEDELYWSEITNYNLHEVCINIDRVDVIGKYKLASIFTGIEE